MDTENQIPPIKQISLAIPTHCRYTLLLESFRRVLDDDRIREVVISDDCSPDGSFEKIVALFCEHPKIRIFRNKENMDCYANKRQAVERATSEWVILFDDDNILDRDYLDRLYSFPIWTPSMIYAPDWAKPHFNYQAFAGMVISRRNVARMMLQPHFKTALNTCNYFVHRQSFLDVWDGSVNPHTSDSLYQCFNWLRAGKQIMIVAGLQYFHRVHEGSHYKHNWRKTGNFAKQLEQRLRQLR